MNLNASCKTAGARIRVKGDLSTPHTSDGIRCRPAIDVPYASGMYRNRAFAAGEVLGTVMTWFSRPRRCICSSSVPHHCPNNICYSPARELTVHLASMFGGPLQAALYHFQAVQLSCSSPSRPNASPAQSKSLCLRATFGKDGKPQRGPSNHLPRLRCVFPCCPSEGVVFTISSWYEQKSITSAVGRGHS